MTKRVPLDRLRDISKRRPIRQQPMPDHAEELRLPETIKVEWPIVGPTEETD